MSRYDQAMKDLQTIAAFLDRTLSIADFKDSSNNGVQVANSGRVRKVCCGVDASMDFFRQARRRGADLLICHHGISWGDSLKTIAGLNYKRVSYLVNNDMALYGCHLPLDAHRTLGNNAQICRLLKLKKIRRFGKYAGTKLGFQGNLPRPMAFADFKALVRKLISRDIRTMDFGKKTVSSVAIVSGAAAGNLEEAAQCGADVFLSGEPTLSAHNLAQELGINAVFAGHYATEGYGVKAIAALLRSKFGIPAEFVDLAVPY